jgi:hypothetical protein
MGAFDDLLPARQGGRGFDDLIPSQSAAEPPQAQRPIHDQELSLGEKLVSMLPKGAQQWLSNPSVAGVGLGKGSAVHGVMLGAADPVVGAAQLSGLGQNTTINQAIDAKNAEYEQARAAAGRDGFDAARFAGNVASPANLVIAQAAPINAATKLGKVAQGARAGALGGAAAPVVNADQSYLPEKILQTASGAAAGGALAPVASSLGEAVTRRVAALSPAEKAAQADAILRETVNRFRREGIELDRAQINTLRQHVSQALDGGQKIDPAALLRKQDFDALGIDPTLGQITRDPAQFARERNLRGVSGVGEPLMQRLEQQNTRLQDLITGRARGAADENSAGEALLSSLRSVDDAAKTQVDAAYGKARDHLGRAAPMDSAGFSQQANATLDEQMLGRWLPEEVRGILNDVTLGKIPFNVNTAVQIDSVLSQAQRAAMNSGNPAQAKAVGAVRDALNKAGIADNVGEDAKMMFDTARGMARDRFKTHEAIPALKAAVNGDVNAQDFVRRFLINGKADEVRALAGALPEDAAAEARHQFGAALERAAFGENTGDKAFSPERFSRFINQPGMRQKLAAFFSPEDVEQITRIGRVGAYMNSFPAFAPVNTSNTASALADLGWLSRIPGVPQSVGLLNIAKTAAENQHAVNSALGAKLRNQPADIPAKQLELLSRILGGGMGGVAGAAGTGIGD